MAEYKHFTKIKLKGEGKNEKRAIKRNNRQIRVIN